MGVLRRLILAFGLMAGLAPAFGQAPAPVPALPDAERRTAYSITSSKCSCNVNFALYGDSTDYQNWVEVWINGTLVNYNDPVYGWTITSPTGPLSRIPRPVTDAVLTFNSAQTGTIQIVGARRPRRVSQIQEGQGVAARDLNQALTDIVAQNRETWDKVNDFTGRAVTGIPGETLKQLPPAAARSGKFFTFDDLGNPGVTSAPSLGGGNVIGIGPTVIGHVPVWADTTGNSLSDSGVFPGVQSIASVAALRTMPVTRLTNGQVIFLSGYATANDGGGGQFIVSLSNATDDGGCVINSTVGVASFSRVNCYQGGKISILYFGGKGDNSTDNTPAFTAMMNVLATGVGSQLPYGLCGFFPAGTYSFNTQPGDITSSTCLQGVSLGATTLIRNFSPVGSTTQGLFNFKQGTGGSTIGNMAIIAAAGTTGGSLIQILSTSTYAIGLFTLHDLDLTTYGTNTNTYTLYINGSFKTTDPSGVRSLHLRNVHIFGCSASDACAQFISVIGFNWEGGGVYAAGGTGAGSGSLLFSGTSTVNSQYINVNISNTNGQINLAQTQNAIINVGQIGAASGVSVANDATVSSVSVHAGNFFGSIGSSWVNSHAGP